MLQCYHGVFLQELIVAFLLNEVQAILEGLSSQSMDRFLLLLVQYLAFPFGQLLLEYFDGAW
jgi:hypothetical protein